MAMPALNSSFTSRLEMPLTASLLAKSQNAQLGRAQDAQSPTTIDFASLLGQSVGEVNSLQQESTQSVQEMLTGGDVQPAEVFASVQKADMAFRMLLQVRNKLMQAYEEVNAIRI